MTNTQLQDQRVRRGAIAAKVASDDYGLDSETAAVDTVANVLHWARARGVDTDYVIRMARRHLAAELAELAR